MFALGSVATAVFAYWPRWQIRSLLRDPLALAHWIERHRPVYRNDLTAWLDFDARPPATEDAAVLRTLLRERMERLLASDEHEWDDILPHTALRTDRYVCTGLVVVAIGLMFTSSFRHALTTNMDAVVSQQEIPQQLVVGDWSVVIQPPSYTGRPEQQFDNITNGLSVLEGSMLHFQGRTLVPIKEAWALDAAQQENTKDADAQDARIPMSVHGGDLIDLHVLADTAQHLQFGFVTASGKEVMDWNTVQIRIVEDKTPEIRLVEPSEDLEVVAGDVVEFSYDVRDDYGISEVNLVWYFKGREQDATRIPLLGRDTGTFAEDTAPFDTAPLYMQPGDEVIVYIEARDNVSFREPNVGTSDAITLFVKEEHQDLDDLMALEEALFEAILKQLGSLLPVPMYTIEPRKDQGFAMVLDAEQSEEHNARTLEQLHASLRDDWPAVRQSLSAILSLLQDMNEPDAREQQLLNQLLTTLDKIEKQLARSMEQFAPMIEHDVVTAAQLKALWPVTKSWIEENEKSAHLLHTLISDHKGEDVARALQELTHIRERIRALLEQYKETKDPELRARIQRELDRLARRMQDLMQKLASQMENLPQEHFNAEALEKGDTQEQVDSMRDAMKELQRSLSEGNADAAMQAFDELSKNLDELYQNFGDPSLDADEQMLSEFDQQMGELMNQMSAVEQMQQAIEEETRKMTQELQEEKREANQDALLKELEAAMRAIQDAQQHTHDASRQSDDPDQQQATQQALSKLQTLEKSLREQNLSIAEDAALDAMEALLSVKNEAAKQRRYTSDKDQADRLKQVERHGEQDAAHMRDIAEKLNQWQQRLQPEPGQERQGQMDSLNKRQQEAADRLEQLRQSLEASRQKYPMMNPDDDPDMKRSSQGMQQSSESLQRGKPSQAHDGQQQALEGLQAMREGLKQQMAQRRQKMQQEAQRGQGAGGRRDKVDVTQESERDLRVRRQIMDAMREDSLKAWEKPIQKYYESLVR